ncbi:MAG: UDP-2,3-diacylglucosamine diphosphatase [Bdellovibrionota bacterium]
MRTRAYFVSDLHLTSSEDPRTQTFVRFLRDLHSRAVKGGAESPTHLFLVGDIFDLWIGSHDYFVSRFRDVVDSIRVLVRDGIEVHYFEGNHDLHLREFWATDVGARVHPDAMNFELAGRIVRVEHGDLINPDDKGYLFLRRFLRSRSMTTIALKLPSPLVRAIGEKASRASRDYTSTAKRLPEDRIRTLIRTHAEKVAREENFDMIVTGHVHVRDDHEFEIGTKKIRSVNLGSWFDEAKALVLDETGARFAPV